MFIQKLFLHREAIDIDSDFLVKLILFSRVGINREKKDVPLTLAISGVRVITRGRNCYIMDP
jgi:hypothetical protein